MELLNFEVVRVLVALVGTGLAAYQDYKTSFIDDKILFSMLGIGAVLTLLSLDQTLILYTFAVAAFVFLFGYLLYRQGQLGMGDVLLFVALQLLLPFHPALFSDYVTSAFPLQALGALAALNPSFVVTLNALKHALFFLTIFVVSSYAATIASSAYYAKLLFESGKPLKPGWVGLAVALLLLVLGYFLSGIIFSSWAGLLFLLLLLSTAFFLTFRDQLLQEIVMKRITLKELEDEDILALEMMPKDLVKKYKIGKVLTKSEVKKLKGLARKEGMKTFPVYKVLPRFGPYIFVGLLFALFFGDLFSLLFLLAGK